MKDALTKIKDFLVTNYPNGIISDSYRELTGPFGVTTPMGVFYYLQKLEKEGFLKRAVKYSKGGKSQAQWVILAPEKEDHAYNTHTPIITEMFQDIQVTLFQTPKGYAVPISQVSKATDTYKRAALEMIERNIELFEDFVIDVFDPQSKQICKCLTRDGIIAYIMKVSANRLSEETKKRVIAFQKWAVETLGTLLEQRKVELSLKKQEAQLENLAALTGLTENEFKKIIRNLQLQARQLAKEKTDLERQKNRLIKLNENLVGDVVYLKEQLLQRVAL